jgi:hypothetical protein
MAEFRSVFPDPLLIHERFPARALLIGELLSSRDDLFLSKALGDHGGLSVLERRRYWRSNMTGW